MREEVLCCLVIGWERLPVGGEKRKRKRRAAFGQFSIDYQAGRLQRGRLLAYILGRKKKLTRLLPWEKKGRRRKLVSGERGKKRPKGGRRDLRGHRLHITLKIGKKRRTDPSRSQNHLEERKGKGSYVSQTSYLH